MGAGRSQGGALMPIILDGEVRVAPPALPTVRVAPPAPSGVVVLPVAGPSGPPGAPGTPGGSAFVHTQSTPAATWIVTHNLARKVHVSIFNLDEQVVFADVEHGSLNVTTITFPVPVAGSAVFS